MFSTHLCDILFIQIALNTNQMVISISPSSRAFLRQYRSQRKLPDGKDCPCQHCGQDYSFFEYAQGPTNEKKHINHRRNLFQVTHLQPELAVHAYLQPSMNLSTLAASALSPVTLCRIERDVSSKLSTAVLTRATPMSTAFWASRCS